MQHTQNISSYINHLVAHYDAMRSFQHRSFRLNHTGVVCSANMTPHVSNSQPCTLRCVGCENQSGSAVDRDIGEEGRRSGPSHVASAGGGRCCTRWCSTRRRCGRGSRSGVTIREKRVRRGLVRWCDATAGGSVGNGVAASCTGAAQGDDGVCRLSARKCEAARR